VASGCLRKNAMHRLVMQSNIGREIVVVGKSRIKQGGIWSEREKAYKIH